MPKDYELPLNETDLVSIVLYGAFQLRQDTKEKGWSMQFADDLDEKLMRLLNREKKNNLLIKEHFHFDEQGAFPYSREVSSALCDLAEVRILTRIMGEGGRIARPGIEMFAREPVKRGRISEEDYKIFFELGKQLPIKRPVYI